MTGAELEALAKRVEGARGGAGGLDVAVWCAVKEGWEVAERDADSVQCVGLPRWTRLPPDYTASVDAVLELIAEVLPGWLAFLSQQPDGWSAEVTEGFGQAGGYGPTPALALLAATLRALAQQTESGR